jgi:putative oxidoreductase
MKLNIILKLAIAVILLQTLYFKFTASAESVYIFTTLGIEPFGRIGIGVLELIAAISLFPKRTSFYAALLAAGLMAGALFSHLTKLGIEVMNDGGELFILALVVLTLSLVLAWRVRGSRE